MAKKRRRVSRVKETLKPWKYYMVEGEPFFKLSYKERKIVVIILAW